MPIYKLKKRIYIIILFLTFLQIVACDEYIDNNNNNLKIHFIDVGQGDSILIQFQNQNLLIDAGDNDQGQNVIDYLKKNNVNNIDYVIASHPHSDHIGGLDEVINKFYVHNIYLPNTTHTTRTFEDLINSIQNKNIKPKVPKLGTKIQLGDADITFIHPDDKVYDNLNNYSISVKVEHKQNSFLFLADAEIEVENLLLNSDFDLNSNVFKASHHGSSTSNSEKFIKKVDPEVVVFSVGKDNKYNHPHKEVLDTFKKYNANIFRTDEDGTVILVSNGVEIFENSSQNKNLLSKKSISENLEQKLYVDDKGQGLIKGNINSKGEKIYHMPDGAYYNNTKAEVYFKTQNEAILEGFKKSSR